MKHRLIAFFPLILLNACASQGEFPSLAPRPYEASATAAPPSTAPVAVASNAETIARINAAVALAESAAGSFDSALALARKASAGSGGHGSESWIAAQMAISRLERARAPVQTALANLDAEMRGLMMGPPSVDRAALDAALQRIGALDQAQRDAVTGLIARVGG